MSIRSRLQTVQRFTDEFQPGDGRGFKKLFIKRGRVGTESHEFLGQLANSDPALAEAAVEAVDEVERLSLPPASSAPESAASSTSPSHEPPDGEGLGERNDAGRPDRDEVLAEALAHLERVREAREGQKLLAELRRTTDERRPSGAPENKDRDEVVLLKQLQEKARQPDLRRV